MSRTKMVFLFAGAAASLSSVALAQSSNLDQGRAYATEALADAQGRTSTLAAPAASPVTVGGQIQFRYIWNVRDQDIAGNDSTNGFQTRRTKLWAKGEIADGWSYKVQGAFDRDGGTFGLEDAYVDYKADDAWTIRWGQFKLPFMREESVSSSRQLAADRSIANEVFNQDWSQGIQATFAQDAWRFMGAFSDGFGTRNSDFDSGSEADYALTARGEFLGAGDWKNFDDFTSWQGSPFGWMVGGAIHWQSGGNTVGTPDVDVLSVTVDGSLEGDGWNAFISGVWRKVDPNSGSKFDDFGWTIQGGYFVAADWELFGRWSQVFPDKDRGSAKTFSELAVGVNHYVIPESHAAKFTVDWVLWPTSIVNSSSIVGPSTGIGLLSDTGDPQWAIRGQFQLLF
jgi:hypothetical protein